MPNLGATKADTEANGSAQNGGSRRHRRRRRRRRPSMAASSETTTTDGSFHFTDSDSDQSWHSPLGSMDDISVHCDQQPLRGNYKQRRSISLSDDEIDLESGELEMKLHDKEERDCRICHLSLLRSGGISVGGDQVQETSGGMAIELGCSCKGDLGAAHKQCAETWFKTKGNTWCEYNRLPESAINNSLRKDGKASTLKFSRGLSDQRIRICEICGTNALNIAGEQTTEANTAAVANLGVSAAPVALSETRGFWHGRRVMNFLLASMAFAFVISWLFHFNILP